MIAHRSRRSVRVWQVREPHKGLTGEVVLVPPPHLQQTHLLHLLLLIIIFSSTPHLPQRAIIPTAWPATLMLASRPRLYIFTQPKAQPLLLPCILIFTRPQKIQTALLLLTTYIQTLCHLHHSGIFMSDEIHYRSIIIPRKNEKTVSVLLASVNDLSIYFLIFSPPSKISISRAHILTRLSKLSSFPLFKKLLLEFCIKDQRYEPNHTFNLGLDFN